MVSAKDRLVRTKPFLNGRRKVEPFTMLRNFLIRSAAFESLDARAKAALLFLKYNYNGSNNGHVHASSRTLARFLHCSKDSALRALTDLEDRGFIKPNQRGSFDYKERHAPTWILTDEVYNDDLPTKEFTRWVEPVGPQLRTRKKKAGPQPGTTQSSDEDTGK
jgi:hypothetical protein